MPWSETASMLGRSFSVIDTETSNRPAEAPYKANPVQNALGKKVRK